MQKVTIIVPCYNEAARFLPAEFAKLADRPEIQLLMVNDGSKDETVSILRQFQQINPSKIQVLDLKTNQGKAEAVRQGLVQAIASGCDWVGFIDADLATPVTEVCRMVDYLNESPFQVVIGSRVKLLGSKIERKTMRHYLGRIFATLASISLRLPVYDTQCGAKFFRTVPGLDLSLRQPFRSRWVFDVELIGRLLGIGGFRLADFKELPLIEWKDIRGSKLSFWSMARSGLDLAWIGWHLRRTRKPELIEEEKHAVV